MSTQVQAMGETTNQRTHAHPVVRRGSEARKNSRSKKDFPARLRL